MSAPPGRCPRCGLPTEPGYRFCPTCGGPLAFGFVSSAPAPAPYPIANTHTEGFLVVAFLLSFLWFRINGVALLPVGFLGGLVVTWWSQDIDRHFGKRSQFALAVILCLLGAFIGFFL